MKVPKKLLVIADIQHSSPRIAHFLYYLHDHGWNATQLTPFFNDEIAQRNGLPEDFLSRVAVATASYEGDALEWMRRLFYKKGFQKNASVTEQLKEKLGVKKNSRLVHKLLYLYQTFFAYPDDQKNWKKHAIKKALLLMKTEHFDAILSSSPYGTSHIIAHELQKQSGIPWIADFRDPWALNHNYPFGKIRQFFEKRLEQRTLINASAIFTASEMCSTRQRSLHTQNIHTITNGFDPKRAPTHNLHVDSSKLTITYTGTVYEGKQNPAIFFAGLKKFFTLHPQLRAKFEVNFYGSKSTYIGRLVENFELHDVVNLHNSVSRNESLEKQQTSQLLLMFGWEDQSEPGTFQTKLFEYLNARRPILISGGFENEEIKKVVKNCNAGWSAIDEDSIVKTLELLSEKFHSGVILPYDGNEKKIAQFSYPVLSKQLADLLNQFVT